MDNVLILQSMTREQDETGVWREAFTPRQVFCQVHSITRNEFFQAGRNGLNPSYMFTVFRADYEGEVICSFEGKDYAIYRTFLPEREDYIELYAERQGGANGKSNASTQNSGGSTTTGD